MQADESKRGQRPSAVTKVLGVQQRKSANKLSEFHQLNLSNLAANDNYICFEQHIFECAVRRELSGDIDFDAHPDLLNQLSANLPTLYL